MIESRDSRLSYRLLADMRKIAIVTSITVAGSFMAASSEADDPAHRTKGYGAYACAPPPNRLLEKLRRGAMLIYTTNS
jgi:hypothetical protein